MNKKDKEILENGLDCFIGDIDEFEKEVKNRKLDTDDFLKNVKPKKKEEIFKVSEFLNVLRRDETSK